MDDPAEVPDGVNRVARGSRVDVRSRGEVESNNALGEETDPCWRKLC